MLRIVLVLEAGIVESLFAQVIHEGEHLPPAVPAAVNLLKESFPLGIRLLIPVVELHQGINGIVNLQPGIIIRKSMTAINLNRIGKRVITHDHVPGILHGDDELLLAALQFQFPVLIVRDIIKAAQENNLGGIMIQHLGLDMHPADQILFKAALNPHIQGNLAVLLQELVQGLINQVPVFRDGEIYKITGKILAVLVHVFFKNLEEHIITTDRRNGFSQNLEDA